MPRGGAKLTTPSVHARADQTSAVGPAENRAGIARHQMSAEPEQGYWAGRWVGFNRLFKKSWDDEFTRTVLFLSAAGFILAAIGGPLFGWR